MRSMLSLSPRNRWVILGWILSLGVLAWLDPATTLRAQDTLAPQADPRDLGLAIAQNAPLIPGDNQTVLVPDEEENPVVGKLQFSSGDQRIVLLPSGRLTSLESQQVTPTDRPFEPIEPEVIAERLSQQTFQGFKIKTDSPLRLSVQLERRVCDRDQPHFRVDVSEVGQLLRETRTHGSRNRSPRWWSLCFATEEEFQTYREMPEGVVAYYNGISNYVVMYEKSKLAEVAPTIAVKQAISTVAHEGVHQVLHKHRRATSFESLGSLDQRRDP
jgi:hypothetical protein